MQRQLLAVPGWHPQSVRPTSGCGGNSLLLAPCCRHSPPLRQRHASLCGCLRHHGGRCARQQGTGLLQLWLLLNSPPHACCAFRWCAAQGIITAQRSRSLPALSNHGCTVARQVDCPWRTFMLVCAGACASLAVYRPDAGQVLYQTSIHTAVDASLAAARPPSVARRLLRCSPSLPSGQTTWGVLLGGCLA